MAMTILRYAIFAYITLGVGIIIGNCIIVIAKALKGEVDDY